MGTRIYIDNLDYNTTVAQIREVLDRHPRQDAVSIEIVTDPATGKSRGFAFVEMASEEDARSAIEDLHAQTLWGRTVLVNVAHAIREGADPDTNIERGRDEGPDGVRPRARRR